MKKIAFASLLACAWGLAFAQSNVQIYGVVDLGLVKSNGGASVHNGIPNSRLDGWQMAQASASRLGFRGTEDLGNGWSANFLLEHRFQPDTGASNAAPSPFFMQSTLGLSNKDFGTIWMGRDYVPAFWVAVKSDPFGMDGVGQIGPAALLTDIGSNSDNSSRTNNTVGFKSKSFGGLTADIAFSPSEGAGNGSQSGMNLQYQNGALYAGFGFAKKNAGNRPAGVNDEVMNLALHYNFGAFRLLGYVAQGENNTTNQKTRTYSLGADAKLGNGRLKLAYYDVDSDFVTKDRRKIGIGYDYHLSKQTRVYADAGVARSKAATSGNLPSNSAFSIGVRKAF